MRLFVINTHPHLLRNLVSVPSYSSHEIPHIPSSRHTDHTLCSHHAVPNALDEHNRPLDEDIDTLPLLAWDDRMLHEVTSPFFRGVLKLQHVLLFPILSMARFAWSWGSLMTVVGGTDMKPRDLLPERIGLALHYLWYLGLPAYVAGPLGSLAYLVISQMVGGVCLSFVFIQSHNSESLSAMNTYNMHHLSPISPRHSHSHRPPFHHTHQTGMEIYHTKDYDFFTAQLASTRDVDGGWFVDWFMGGLNYQIEHHLFPTLPRHNLHKVRGGALLRLAYFNPNIN